MDLLRALKDRPIEKIFLALSFTGLIYIYAAFKDVLNEQVLYIVSITQSQIQSNLPALGAKYLNNIIPIITFWLLTGIVCYLFYYTLQNIYYHVGNAVAVKLFFTKPIYLRRDDEKIHLLKRLAIHLMVVLVFLFLILVTFFGLAPISVLIQGSIENINDNILFLVISILASVIYWYLAFTIIHFISLRLKDLVICTELECEHGAK